MNASKKLEFLKKEVHAKGFNISMMINLYNKKRRDQKCIGVIPEEIYCDVCIEYLKCRAIKRDFPYFMTVLARKTEEHYANKTQAEAKANKFGKMPENIKSIMKGV